jgi:hypothetical protein
LALLELLARFVAFTVAVARLRDTQQRAAQAAAARRAAEQLRHCGLVYRRCRHAPRWTALSICDGEDA